MAEAGPFRMCLLSEECTGQPEALQQCQPPCCSATHLHASWSLGDGQTEPLIRGLLTDGFQALALQSCLGTAHGL